LGFRAAVAVTGAVALADQWRQATGGDVIGCVSGGRCVGSRSWCQPPGWRWTTRRDIGWMRKPLRCCAFPFHGNDPGPLDPAPPPQTGELADPATALRVSQRTLQAIVRAERGMSPMEAIRRLQHWPPA
jgi:hypothetical protein